MDLEIEGSAVVSAAEEADSVSGRTVGHVLAMLRNLVAIVGAGIEVVMQASLGPGNLEVAV